MKTGGPRPGVLVFEQHAKEYDRWFDEHVRVYRSEVQAVGQSVPPGMGLEVGTGTGRFSTPLGIRFGVEPSRAMAEIARQRGIDVVQALGARLPFRSKEFDYLLLVTVICFVDSPQDLLEEGHRVLRSGGRIILAFIDGESHLGRIYEAQRGSNIFYRGARFYSVAEVVDHVQRAGFGKLEFRQAIFDHQDTNSEEQPVRDGFGEGAFVVISAARE